MGSEAFIDEVGTRLAARARGSVKRSLDQGMEFRETVLPYNAFLDLENNDIEGKTRLF